MMKQLLSTITLLACFSLAGYAQNNADSTERSKPLIDERTRQEARQKANQVEEKLSEEIEKSRNYMQDNQLSWFQPGNLFLGGGIGFGATSGKVYTDINARLGYFFQPGFAAGLRFDYDRLVGNKYHARQAGIFARYYPFRTRVSSFVGASLNGGREFSENIASDTKATYTSVGLELGVMFWILHRLGAEVSYEGNFYNKFDPTLGRGKGGRLKFGVNYYFGQVGNRGLRLAR
ncbi:porin family protein [Spirosoma liriopis]|nr:porin family protein [Spirosoma liriopis]